MNLEVKLPDPNYDLKAVHGTSDEKNIYLMLEFIGNMNKDHIMNLLIDLNNDNNADVPLGIFWGDKPWSDKIWVGNLMENMNYEGLRGIIDIEIDDNISKY